MTNSALLPIEFEQGLFLDPEKARAIGETLMGEYAFAEPFPHTVIDNFLPESLLQQVLAHFPNEEKAHDTVYMRGYGGFNKRQISPYDCDAFISSVFAFFNSPPMLGFLEGVTNTKRLLPDPYFTGGGLHEISTGGYLGIHADFRVNESLQLLRRMNVLIYLNRDWQAEYGGNLELWDRTMTKKMVEVAPIFNRCVIFNTDADTFHGHPNPLTTPAGITRKSIALYYYTAQPIDNTSGESRHTLYVARPDDSIKNKLEAKRMAKRRDKRAKKRLQQDTGIAGKVKSAFNKWFS